MTSHQPPRRHRISPAKSAFVTGLVALGLAGCGGTSPSTSPGSTPSAGTTPSATGAPASAAPAPTRTITSTPSTTASSSSAAPASSSAPVTSSGPPGTSGPSDPAGPARCQAAALRGSLGRGEGAGGSTYTPVILTNSGSVSCELTGYPGVSFVAGDNGTQVGAAAGYEGSKPRTVVRIRPGGSATATLQVANYQAFSPADCKAVPVRGLRVYPPGSTAALYIPFSAAMMACSGRTTTKQLGVTNVVG